MTVWERQLDMWNREWEGPSFNAEGLVAELKGRSAAEAVSERNYEDYTVWGVALHVHRYKEMLLAELEGRQPDYPEGEDNFPPVPEAGLTDRRWAEVIAGMDETHHRLLGKLRTADEAFLESTFAPWQITWGETVAWACGHDTYHTAQIRNMRR